MPPSPRGGLKSVRHCGLASCLKVVGKSPDGLCECGNLQTVQHVMLSCNKCRRERQMFYKAL